MSCNGGACRTEKFFLILGCENAVEHRLRKEMSPEPLTILSFLSILRGFEANIQIGISMRQFNLKGLALWALAEDKPHAPIDFSWNMNPHLHAVQHPFDEDHVGSKGNLARPMIGAGVFGNA
jgi:hypothetical protein